MTVKGAKQGVFKGGSGQKANVMTCIAFDMSLVSPRDAATGQAGGKRQWKPITVTKEWDASSPQFFEAAATNEILTQVVIDFSRRSPNGTIDVFYTVTLTDASVTQIDQTDSLLNLRDAPNMAAEKISFTFRKIEIEEKTGKTTYVDDWTAR